MIAAICLLIVRLYLSTLLWTSNLLTHSHLVFPDTPVKVILDEKLLSDTVVASSCEKACLAISSHLHNAVYVGQTGDNFDFWDAKKREIVPACRVEPSNGEDVSFILKALTSRHCHFIVKSGGHERGTPGTNTHNNGVVVDLVRMKGLLVADDRESVTIGPGWRWASLYKALEEKNLMVLGGRLGEVGVGGLLLGGGISFHSNWRGLACDSVLSYEVVFPNATTATVSQNTHPELYRALRGGGSMNFGIIVSFTLEAFPPRQLWYGTKAFKWENLPDLLRANHQITTNAMNLDPHISVMNVFMCYPKHRLCFGNLLAQHAAHNSTAEWPLAFKVHENLGDLSQTIHARTGSMSNITSSFDDPTRMVRYRTIYATFTYTPSVELEQRLLAVFREETEHASLENVAGWLPGVVMHPFSSTMLKMTRKRGGNTFSFIADHEGPLTVLNIAWQWNEKMDDNKVYASYHRTMDRFEKAAREMGLWHPYKYISYAEAAQDVLGHASNFQIEELRKLQKEIDPSGTFAEGGLARGPFKLVSTSTWATSQREGSASAASDRGTLKDEL